MDEMKNKKWVARSSSVLLVSALLAAGCSSTATPDPGTTGKDAPAPTTGPSKVSMMVVLNTPEVPSDIIEKKVEELTNTQLEVNFVPQGIYDEKLNAALATGSLPQMVFLGNQASFFKYRDAFKNNQFWEIGPYLKDYPNLSQLNQNVLNNMKIGGKIYTLYQEVPVTRQGIIYRKDLADKLGLSAPKTVDDLYNMMKKLKESKLAEVPLADRNDLIYGAFKTLSSYFGTPNNWGLVDGKLVPEFMTQGYMDTMKFMKKLRDEGLINQDFPVTSKTDQQNFMFTGKSAVYIGSIQDVNSIAEKTEANIKEAKYDVENRILGANGQPGVWGTSGYGSPVAFPKSAIKNENELKQVLAFVDKLFDPEIANLIQYGVEGTHYTLKDGKVVPTTDAKLLVKDVQGYTGFGLSRITNIKPKEYVREAAAKADQLTNEATKFAIPDPAAALESITFNEKGARLQELIKDATYKFMVGDIDEKGFQDAVKRWHDQGGTAIINELNESYKASNGK
jgi:putative aldouronate transport system substrate-binding protein